MRQVQLSDGATTTVHVARFPSRMRLVALEQPAPLESWCAAHGIRDAVSGGFSVKPEQEPLGELWTGGRRQAFRAFRAPWGGRRGAVAIADGRVRIDVRDRLPVHPGRDLLEAGPLLVRDGRSAVAGVDDPEGFSDTAGEFDQDLTASREPRMAIAVAGREVLAVAADGRAPGDAGLTLWELADLLVDLGATAALNLDGGSAAVVVAGGERLNVPRSNEGEDLEESSPSTTAFVFE